jgi:hypothetical protein
MKTPVDPPRLIDSADADPALRHALRLIHEDAPSLAALGALAESAEHALSAEPLAKTASAAAAKPLLAKLVIGTVAGSALAYFGLPAAYQAAVPRPPAAHVAPPSSTLEPPAAAPMPGTGSRQPSRSTGSAAAELRATEPTTEVTGREDPSTDAPPGEARRTATGSSGSPSPTTETALHGAQGDAKATTHEKDRAAEPRPPAEANKPNEMDLLESAQQALGREPRRALAYLREHRSTFPRSKFAQERDVLVLEALQRLHDRAAVKDGARAFFARYPRSPHRARVSKLIEEAQ